MEYSIDSKPDGSPGSSRPFRPLPDSARAVIDELLHLPRADTSVPLPFSAFPHIAGFCFSLPRARRVSLGREKDKLYTLFGLKAVMSIQSE